MDADELLQRTQEDFFWVPPDARIVARDEITYVACPRDETYVNTVIRTRADDARIPALVDEVARAHAGVQSRWTLVGPSLRPGVERAIEAGGYRPAYSLYGYVAPVDGVRVPSIAPGIVVRPVATLDAMRTWSGVLARAFSREDRATPERLARELVDCTGDGARSQRFVAYDARSGEALAAAGVNWFPALGVAYFWAGGTAPEARGRGAYAALVAARVARARELGLGLVGMYARVETSAPIVERLGFVRGGPLVDWVRAAPREATIIAR